MAALGGPEKPSESDWLVLRARPPSGETIRRVNEVPQPVSPYATDNGTGAPSAARTPADGACAGAPTGVYNRPHRRDVPTEQSGCMLNVHEPHRSWLGQCQQSGFRSSAKGGGRCR